MFDPLIRSVRNHPSIAIWATSDEEDFENYREITKHLAPRLFAEDPQRPWPEAVQREQLGFASVRNLRELCYPDGCQCSRRGRSDLRKI